jgi:hypothetical protein
MASHGVPSSPGSTFHRFPALPPELRLRIWYFALQTPQMVTLYPASKCDKQPSKTDSIYANPIERPLLCVNAEARKAALHAYLPGFYDRSGSKVVWVNPKLDTLYLNRIYVSLFGKYEIAKHIERIALAVEDWEWFEDFQLRNYLRRQIRFLCDEMTSLKEVQIVVWDERNWSQTDTGPVAQYHPCSPRVEVWNATYRAIAIASIRKRENTVEQFRQVMEQTRRQTGFRPAQTSIAVRPIVLGKCGDESRWDHGLELLYRCRAYVDQSEGWKSSIRS